jgi:hypothetical protein
MSSHGAVAKAVRLRKEKFPEYYCKAPGCLFAVKTALGTKVCPKHSVASAPRFDTSRTNPNGSGAPWDNDLKMYADQD